MLDTNEINGMNKKLIIAAALCGLALGSRAQTEKGNFLLGGNYSFNSKKDNAEAPRINSFTIGPKFGYFIGNNLAIGLDASYIYSSRDSWVTYTTRQAGPVREFNYGFRYHGFNFAPFIRHYIDLNTRFKFFSNLSVSAGKNTGKYTGEYTGESAENYVKYESRNYGASLSPGFAFFPTKKLAIEFSTYLLNYQRLEYSEKFNIPNSTNRYYPQVHHIFQFGLSTIQPSIGINYHF